jgi:hypothetical protein
LNHNYYYKEILSEQTMKKSERLFGLGVLAFAVGALAFLSAPIASLTPALAQTTNATTTQEQEHTSNETATEGTTTVRDSVFALLAGETIPAGSFIHLYDTTPYHINNGHIAAKIPCGDDSAPLLTILVGVAPDFTNATLELVANLSTPGELCLYHADLPPAPEPANATTTTASANATTTSMVTDIAILNPGDEDVTLPDTSTVVIGINEIGKGAAHGHEEGQEQAQAGTP